MEIVEDCIDDILNKLYGALLEKNYINEGSRGKTSELLGVALRLSNPRARISRSEDRGKPFSALGELLWYLSASDDLEFIEPYVPLYAKEAQEGRVHGAYGPRLFRMRDSINQIDNVVELLKGNTGSRRAVIQLFNAEDISQRYPDIPCTTSIQLHLRDGVLHMSVTMRSNDAYIGLPHDVFCFTMLQEMFARKLNAELGEYYHYAGSMHIYEDKIESAQRYVDEGYQRKIEMPRMPDGDPFEIVSKLLSAEGKIRNDEEINIGTIFPDGYWADIIRMIAIFWSCGPTHKFEELENSFMNPIYKLYLEARRKITLRRMQQKKGIK